MSKHVVLASQKEAKRKPKGSQKEAKKEMVGSNYNHDYNLLPKLAGHPSGACLGTGEPDASSQGHGSKLLT